MIMVSRKGASFTMIVVIGGTVALIAAISTVTLGGTGLQNIFDTVFGLGQDAETEAQIEEKCSQLVSDVNSLYCDQNLNESSSGSGYTCGELGGAGNPTGTDQGCSFIDHATQAAGIQDPENVTVQGETVSCIDKGYMTDGKCPAGQ